MTTASSIYKVHKWLAVVAGLFTVCWFVSGVLMTLPGHWWTLSPGVVTDAAAEAVLPGAPRFEDARVAAADAIATVRAHVPAAGPVTAVRLRRLPGHVAYEVVTANRGAYLVDAVSGELFAVDETLAHLIVARFRGRAPIALSPRGSKGQLQPGYRIAIGDGKGTVFYVDGATGQTISTDHLHRLERIVRGLHFLSPLRAILPGALVTVIMFTAALAGVLMTFAGVLILVTQLRRWWRVARASATM
jgi:peptidase YpeB-like protein